VVQVAVIRHAVRQPHGPLIGHSVSLLDASWLLYPLLSLLFRRTQPYTEADLRDLVGILIKAGKDGFTGHLGFGNLADPRLLYAVVRQVERYAASHDLSTAVREDLERLRKLLGGTDDPFTSSDQRRAVGVLDDLLGRRDEETRLIEPGDDWGHAATAALATFPREHRAAWVALLTHAATATSTKPSQKWLVEARKRIDALGEPVFAEQTGAWLALLSLRPRNTHYAEPGSYPVPSAVIPDRNGTLLRGLAWCCSLLTDATTARALGDAALAAYKKVPEIGPRSAKAANALVWALGAMQADESAAQLQRLAQRVVYGPAGKLIEDALLRTADRRGLSRADLDDMAVPAFELKGVRMRHEIGDYAVEATIAGAHTLNVQWFGPGGATLAAEPASLKRQHAEGLKAVKSSIDDLRTQLSIQRLRIERILLSDRSWTLDGWRQRWMDHPLLSFFARRLIWAFEDGGHTRLGAWSGDTLVDVEDQPLVFSTGDVQVRLWHPITADPATVLAWRAWLDRHTVTQPFKQAHREVYLLTDAERATATYSNRFGGHLVRQHQFRALCKERGWSYRLQGSWDGANDPTIDLHEWNLRAEFGVEAPDDEESPAGALTARFINVFIATDQVRFRRNSAAPKPTKMTLLRRFMENNWQLPAVVDDTMRLEEVPSLVFSEMMRDIDLFVGVCSIGNAPAFEEAWPADLRVTWESASFGELSAAARTRHDVLSRLLPKLAIAPRCTLEDRFLSVRGDLHTYRIHLGSGNIIMDDGRYLCIVPAQNAFAGNLHLPFEGDGTLAVILSKAFLLADDRAITDDSIVRQL
jgi:hypothetical protein